ELLPIARLARDVTLVDAARAHGAPLVMVALQPDLGDGREPVILRDLIGRQMTVVIDDGQLAREVVVKIARSRRLEQKILVNEGTCFHGCSVRERTNGFLGAYRRDPEVSRRPTTVSGAAQTRRPSCYAGSGARRSFLRRGCGDRLVPVSVKGKSAQG